jgi:hypothetical protein
MLQTPLRMSARPGIAAAGWTLGLTLLIAASSAFADGPPAAPAATPPPIQVGTPAQAGAEAQPQPKADPSAAAGTGTRAPDLDDVPPTEPIAPARSVSSEPQVEQKRDGSRHVSEVIVVPAGTNIHYSLINREGQRPTSPLATTPGGLSTQRFIRLDF